MGSPRLRTVSPELASPAPGGESHHPSSLPPFIQVLPIHGTLLAFLYLIPGCTPDRAETQTGVPGAGLSKRGKDPGSTTSEHWFRKEISRKEKIKQGEETRLVS